MAHNRRHCPQCGRDYVDKLDDPAMIAPATLTCILGHIWTNTPTKPGGILQALKNLNESSNDAP